MDTNDTKKSQNRVKKEQLVEEMVTKLEASNGLVFTDYQGLTNLQTEALKKELKASQATLAVTKNTLLKISLGKSSKYADLVKDMEIDRPTATLFLGEDVIGPLKAVAKAFKNFNLPRVKFGIIDGQALTEEQVLKLSTLPNRETLLAQFVGMLQSPITGLVVTLNGTMQKFVVVLNEISKKIPAPEPVKADAPVAEEAAAPASDAAAAPVDVQEPEAKPAEPTAETPQPVATDAAPTETEAEAAPALDQETPVEATQAESAEATPEPSPQTDAPASNSATAATDTKEEQTQENANQGGDK